jgi:hypothetical protein
MTKPHWLISWGPPSDQLYPEVLEETYPYRSTKMTLEYIKAKPQVNVVAQLTTTRTLDLNAKQVEGIVRLWARAHAGFTDPEIETTSLNDFDGLTLTEVTHSYGDDSDTPVEGD